MPYLTDEEHDSLIKENKELRLYLKTFLRATIDPEDRNMGVHEANPTLDWQFVHVEDEIDGRRITGGQIRRAAEIIGFDKLDIEPCTRTISDDLAETASLRRQREALRATIQGMILAVQGRGEDPIKSTALLIKQYAEVVDPHERVHEWTLQVKKRARFLDEAIEIGKNILDQTKKV